MKTLRPSFRLCFVALALLLAAAGCGKKEEAKKSSTPASAGVAPPPEGAVELKVKLPPGATFPIRIEVQQKSEMRIPGAPRPMIQQTEMNQELTMVSLKEYEGGGREVEVQFGDVDMTVNVNGREAMTFDSRGEALNEANNPVAGAFRKLVGAKLKYLLDASNNVAKIEGWSELVQKLTSGSSAAQMMSGMFTEDYFKQIADFAYWLPGKPVQPGDTWPVKRRIVMGPLGPALLDLNYTFKNWEPHENRQCAHLEFSGPIVGETGSTNAGMMGVRFTILDGTTRGQSWFDPALGMNTDATIDLKLNVLMSFTGTNAPARGPAPGGAMTNAFGQTIRIKLLSDAK